MYSLTARDCGTFDSVENGRIVGNATTFRSILSFECITGYEVSGSSSVECQADGNWSSTNVQCNGKGYACHLVVTVCVVRSFMFSCELWKIRRYPKWEEVWRCRKYPWFHSPL